MSGPSTREQEVTAIQKMLSQGNDPGQILSSIQSLNLTKPVQDRFTGILQELTPDYKGWSNTGKGNWTPFGTEFGGVTPTQINNPFIAQENKVMDIIPNPYAQDTTVPFSLLDPNKKIQAATPNMLAPGSGTAPSTGYTDDFLKGVGLKDYTQPSTMNFGGYTPQTGGLNVQGYTYQSPLDQMNTGIEGIFDGPTELGKGETSLWGDIKTSWGEMEGKDQFGLAAGVAMAGLQGYNAWQANEIAQEQLDFQMDAFNKNFGMQQTAYNDNIQAKNRTLASATGSNEYAHDYVGDRKNQNIA